MTNLEPEMRDWNVVASVRGREFVPAIRLLEEWGPVQRTDYYNVLVMRVEDVNAFLEGFRQRVEDEPGTLNIIARAVPSFHRFNFHTRKDFDEQATRIVLGWTADLAGKSFHVRIHRRGFRQTISSQEEEQLLADALLRELENRGTPGRITFADPDVIVAVETVGGQAGLSLWRRQDRERYPFLALS